MPTEVETPVCIYCDGPNTAERVEIDYTHCSDIECVGRWRRERNEAKGLKLAFMHKQGLAWMYEADVKKNDLKRQGG